MSFSSLISFIAAGLSGGIGIFVLLRDSRSLVHRTFITGMLILSMEAVFAGVGFLAETPDQVMKWQRLGMATTGLVPGIWLLFTLTYARIDLPSFSQKYWPLIFGSFAFPLAFVIPFWNSFFAGDPIRVTSSSWLIRLGWSGYAFHLCLLICFVIILMNLEKTLKESAGHIRWQVKFMVLGLGSLFAARIYTGSQAVLFHSQETGIGVIHGLVLVIAGAMILKSLARAKVLNVDFYPSHSLLYNSFTLLAVGFYFLAVGVFAKVIGYFSEGASLYLDTFLIFLAIVGTSVLLLSDRFRNRIKRFVSLHFKRPFYDYRKEWLEFTQATASLTDVRDLCSAIVRKGSKTFETLSVTIWLTDEKEEGLLLGASTVFTDLQAKDLTLPKAGSAGFIRAIRHQSFPMDLVRSKENWALDFKERNINELKDARIRYCAPLSAGGSFLGVLALDDRVGDAPLSATDFDLLKTIADQTASLILNLRLSERFRQAKELEALQTMSAFMMHDLKNLASSLSLTIQNLPVHFENEEFRKDALQIMHRSVTRVNRMCVQLSTLSKKIELKRTDTDLNALVRACLLSLNGSSQVSLYSDFSPLPRLMVDPEQIQKVITNLILNANEAVGSGGEVRVTTGKKDGWAILCVSDNGCGMSKEFMEQSLFRPFKTSKKEGMGIGLFHSRTIVEAHRGYIEVESKEGKGSTFKVMLPLKG